MTGMLGFIGVGKETTWGTAVAVTDYVEAMQESLVTAIDRFETRQIVAALYEPDDAAGVVRNEGDIVFGGHPRAMGYFLNGAFGANSITSVLSGFFYTNAFYGTQTLSSSLNPLPPYTLEIFRPSLNLPSSSFRFAGAQVSKLSMNVKPNQDLECTASIIAQAQTLLTKTTASFPSSPTQMFTFDTASVQLGGAAVDRFEELTVEIDNQLEGIPTLNNSTNISRIRRTGSQLIRVSGTVEFDAFSDFLNFTSQTEQRLVVSFFKASSFALVIDVPRMVFTEMPVQIGGRDRLTVNFAAMGRYHSGSANAISVRLSTTNTF